MDRQLTIPNTRAGFAAFWAHLERRRTKAGVSEIVCAVGPTRTYHQALATFLETHGVDVVLVCNSVAALNRRTLDRTWRKSDPKDAHNLGDLLERGLVLFYALPEGPSGTLGRLVRLLRAARTELSAGKARFRNTLLPALGPAGEPLPPAVAAALPAGGPDLPPALAFELTDLAARLVSVRTRIARIEAELLAVAAPLPAYRLLLTLPGVGPTLAAILLAEIGDIAWYSKFSQLRKLAGLDIVRVRSGQWAGTARISRCGRPLLRWALYQAALGAARTAGGRAWRATRRAKRPGDPHAFFKATVELAAKLLRLVWGVWRSGQPYDPARGGARPAAQPARATRGARAGRRAVRSVGGQTGVTG